MAGAGDCFSPMAEDVKASAGAGDCFSPVAEDPKASAGAGGFVSPIPEDLKASAGAGGFVSPIPEDLNASAKASVMGSDDKMEVLRVRPYDEREEPPGGTNDESGYLVFNQPNGLPREPSNNKDILAFETPPGFFPAYIYFFIMLDRLDRSEPSSEGEGNEAMVDMLELAPLDAYDVLRDGVYKTPYGLMKVTYAMLRNAVLADMQFKFPSLLGDDSINICGKITARSELFPIGSVLFDCKDEGITVGCMQPIPLAKPLVAVPLIWPLIIEVDLRTSSGLEIVRCKKRFFPELYGEHEKVLTGNGGSIEVMITWQDMH